MGSNMLGLIKRIKYFILASILCSIHGSTYANFGSTCQTPSSHDFPIEKLNYLQTNSVFGYILSLIDIENCGATYSGGCTPNANDSMAVCIKKTDNVSDVSANNNNSSSYLFSQNNPIRLGNITTNPSVTTDQNITNTILTLTQTGTQMCLVISSQYSNMPLVCKNIYDSSTIIAQQSQCTNISSGCNLFHPNNNSKTANNFLGSAIQCVYESMAMVFFDPTTCPVQRNSDGQANMATTTMKPFAEFFSTMQLAVASALTLYLIFFGIKIALTPSEASIHDGFIAAAKVLLVIYFSVGSSFTNMFTGHRQNSNGVTDIVLPMMISFADSMSSYVLSNSQANNLCYFDMADYTRDKYFSIWDSLDCRLNIYLGNAKVFWPSLPSGARQVSVPNAVGSYKPSLSDYNWGMKPIGYKPVGFTSTGSGAVDTVGSGVVGGVNVVGSAIVENTAIAIESMRAIAFFAVIFAFLLAGGFIIFFLLLLVILIIIGLVFSVLSAYLISIVFIYLLAYIAPIFVPMALFERTKGYFNNWLTLCMGMALQPVIIVAFGAYMLAIIDSFMFGQCVFVKYSYLDANTTLKYIFELQLPYGSESECTDSVGYKLYRLFQWPAGWKEETFLFFKAIKLNDIYDLQGNVIPGLIFCFFMRYMLEQTFVISAQLSGGMSLNSVTINPSAMLTESVKMLGEMRKGGKKLIDALSKKKAMKEMKDG